MRTPFSIFVLLVTSLALSPSSNRGQGRPIPPGVREADKQINAPVDPPVKLKQKSADIALLKQEADELARLANTIPAQMDQVGRGQLPKDLDDQLKRIEKLAKHLRSEIAP